MYLSSKDPKLENDINNRLEFINLQDTHKTPGTSFEPTANQLFCRNYINPWAPYKRVLNKSGTGLGKTFTALYVAKSFVDEDRPVIVIGYQQDRFFDEIIHRPELGFVNKAEVLELNRLQKLSMNNDPNTIKIYRDYKSKLLRRRNKSITFYGYGEFTNRIFNMQRLDDPKVNYVLIESLRYGLIICDEIHNAYNAVEQNNWGKTIQFVTNVLGPDIYLLLLSATPITNSTEIKDFLNLLADSPGISIGKLKYDHKNNQKEVIDQIIDFTYPKLEHLKLSHEPTDQEISDRVKGKVIFVPDIGIESMPTRRIYGEVIPGIKYLKFIIVPMSNLQDKASRLFPHNHHLRDIGGLIPVNDLDEISTLSAHPEVQNEIKIHTIKTNDGIYLSGEGLQYNNLKRYSPKYCMLLDKIFSAVPGKILVYHHYVHNTGVLTIQEIFKENGIIEDGTDPTEYTRCTICSKRKLEHNESHEFIPMRFLSIHSKLDKNTTDRCRAKFNALSNINGHEFRILLGSRKIREGMDFKAVKTQIILGLPTNISILLQVFGRTSRTMSHEGLPHDEWVVHTYLLICQHENGELSSEQIDYKHKIDDYVKIQHYDLIMNRNAIDAHIMNTPSKLAIDSELGLRALPYTLYPVTKEPPKTTTYFILERYKEEMLTIQHLILESFKLTNIWQIDKLWEYIKTSKSTPNAALFDKRNFIITLRSFTGINIIGDYVINSDKDIEGFARKPTMFNEVKLMQVNTIKESFLEKSIISRGKKKSVVELCDIYESYHISVHVRLLERALLTINNITKEDSEPVDNVDYIIYFYSKFFTLLTPKYIGMSDSDKYIGYIYNEENKYISKSEWKTYPYVDNSLENDTIIGMYSPEMHFKLREPTHDRISDQRKIQRGANCLTRTKHQLLKIIKDLELDTDNEKIYNLCTEIKLTLIAYEEKKKDNRRWFYYH